MTLAGLVTPWSGSACRHIPDPSPYDLLDTRFAAQSRANRWNRPGEPTLYLASDHAVLIAEFARHLRDERDRTLEPALRARRINELKLSLDAMLDLRDAQVQNALSLGDTPECFLDREFARATAGFVRQTTPAQGILAPSVAFLDQPARWVMALFLEKFDLARVVTDVTPDGLLRVEP
jgi:RES domain-containing protein